MKFGFIQTEKATYPVRVLCRTLLRLSPRVSTPGAGARLERRAQEDAALNVEIRAAHAASGKTLREPSRPRGSQGRMASTSARKRVARLMREEGIEGQRKRRFRVDDRLAALASGRCE